MPSFKISKLYYARRHVKLSEDKIILNVETRENSFYVPKAFIQSNGGTDRLIGSFCWINRNHTMKLNFREAQLFSYALLNYFLTIVLV